LAVVVSTRLAASCQFVDVNVVLRIGNVAQSDRRRAVDEPVIELLVRRRRGGGAVARRIGAAARVGHGGPRRVAGRVHQRDVRAVPAAQVIVIPHGVNAGGLRRVEGDRRRVGPAAAGEVDADRVEPRAHVRAQDVRRRGRPRVVRRDNLVKVNRVAVRRRVSVVRDGQAGRDRVVRPVQGRRPQDVVPGGERRRRPRERDAAEPDGRRLLEGRRGRGGRLGSRRLRRGVRTVPDTVVGDEVVGVRRAVRDRRVAVRLARHVRRDRRRRAARVRAINVIERRVRIRPVQHDQVAARHRRREHRNRRGGRLGHDLEAVQRAVADGVGREVKRTAGHADEQDVIPLQRRVRLIRRRTLRVKVRRVGARLVFAVIRVGRPAVVRRAAVQRRRR
jgi:hypothetical protein